MAWLAVNKNGDETISPDKPTRWGGEWAAKGKGKKDN